MERKYEGCFLLTAGLSDEEIEKETGFIEKNISEAGGKIVKKELLGKRELSYPIKKKTEAIYFIFYFTALPEQVLVIKSSFARRENIMRHLIMQRKRLPKEEKENGGTQSQ
ncbi:MAG TPA: 30S ribosomal protein S6 [bacterium]|nr:30S ribosomal protein S6 [bacterium]